MIATTCTYLVIMVQFDDFADYEANNVTTLQSITC